MRSAQYKWISKSLRIFIIDICWKANDKVDNDSYYKAWYYCCWVNSIRLWMSTRSLTWIHVISNDAPAFSHTIYYLRFNYNYARLFSFLMVILKKLENHFYPVFSLLFFVFADMTLRLTWKRIHYSYHRRYCHSMKQTLHSLFVRYSLL